MSSSRGSASEYLALLRAHGTEAQIIDVARGIGCLAVQHTTRSELGAKSGVLRIVRVLRFFLCIQVIEVAMELVEAMNRRQEPITVAKVILAELASGVAERLEQLSTSRSRGVSDAKRA